MRCTPSTHREFTTAYLSPLSNIRKVLYTISTSIFVDVPYWPLYSMDEFISCAVPGPSQWFFFHFGKEIVIAWTHIRWVRWMFQILPLPMAQEVRDSSSGVTPCIVMKNDGVLYHQVLSFSPESMWLQSLCQSERTTARNLMQHKRWIYLCYRITLTKIDALTVYWCLPNIWQKVKNKGEGDNYIEGT